MTAHPGSSGPAAPLTGRRSERRVLDRFVAGVRAGQGRALVLRGEPGAGKTVLLDYLAGRASGCLVARAAGVQSEMELAFAGLHQLCAARRVERQPGGPLQECGRRHETTAALCPACGLLKFGGNFLIGPGAAWARCQARRSGSTAGSVAAASAPCSCCLVWTGADR